jgi:vacuolar-type H+-ATPase subunit I/STV1
VKVARIVAFVFTFACLGLGLLSLLAPTTMSFTAGANHHEWSCGSAAFPKDLMDFGAEGIEDATNCAGGTPATAALAAFVLAGLGLAAVAFTTWRIGRTGGPEASGP